VDPFDVRAVSAAYGAVAADYVAAFADDLDGLPVDRSVLDALAERLRNRGPSLDVGCGPGQVAQYLAARGVEVVGVDLVSQMLLEARRRTADLSLAAGDMRSLPIRTRSCSGVIAFYSIQHLPRPALGEALREFRRLLAPDGLLVVATHLGEGEVYAEEFLGHQIERVGGTLYGAEELERKLAQHGFLVEDARQRGPLPHEHQSNRIYLTAKVAGT
jgi:ubiquinone/menaquinone biosynthesis C-methylase UbiE